ncbi:hypothetical protein BB559_006006 [Furculomyces boomerangus]|uniref:Uncharacterized protein n=2 Tax=Harpellales TaxID=61421 RepID=A0A2T9Y1A6_9FUNG|nr:hypothetical protein BB559_006646 [Furculomyces boomerangus]PVU87512.1 hypothetical protein BB559_006006 [Furculomyces boomerangus]PWA00393.1 hypothetical protein BB558_003546 [Smittium angustum]
MIYSQIKELETNNQNNIPSQQLKQWQETVELHDMLSLSALQFIKTHEKTKNIGLKDFESSQQFNNEQIDNIEGLQEMPLEHQISFVSSGVIPQNYSYS